MSNGQESSGFKYVFWGIVIILMLAFFSQFMWFILGGVGPMRHMIGVHEPRMLGPAGFGMGRLFMLGAPTGILFLLWVGIVGSLVYKDARKRGMDPYLWATVAVFIPFFIGVIIYLVVRSNGHVTCGGCGRPIRSDYNICPYCGQRREQLCPECGKAIAPEWKVCPYCAHTISAEEDAGRTPI